MNSPDRADAGDSASLRPRLDELINRWRAFATRAPETTNADNPTGEQASKIKAEVFEECAATLEEIVKSDARNRAALTFKLDQPAKASGPPRQGRIKKTKLRDRLIDWTMILLFLAVIGGCAYLIVKIMTRWTIKELG